MPRQRSTSSSLVTIAIAVAAAGAIASTAAAPHAGAELLGHAPQPSTVSATAQARTGWTTWRNHNSPATDAPSAEQRARVTSPRPRGVDARATAVKAASTKARAVSARTTSTRALHAAATKVGTRYGLKVTWMTRTSCGGKGSVTRRSARAAGCSVGHTRTIELSIGTSNPAVYPDQAQLVALITAVAKHEAAHNEIERHTGTMNAGPREENITDAYAVKYLGMNKTYAGYGFTRKDTAAATRIQATSTPRR